MVDAIKCIIYEKHRKPIQTYNVKTWETNRSLPCFHVTWQIKTFFSNPTPGPKEAMDDKIPKESRAPAKKEFSIQNPRFPSIF